MVYPDSQQILETLESNRYYYSSLIPESPTDVSIVFISLNILFMGNSFLFLSSFQYFEILFWFIFKNELREGSNEDDFDYSFNSYLKAELVEVNLRSLKENLIVMLTEEIARFTIEIDLSGEEHTPEEMEEHLSDYIDFLYR